MSKKIFVSSASGVQGNKIATKLIEQGYTVSTLTRTDQKLENITVHVGDLSNINVIKIALKGVDAAVYTFPMIFDEKIAINYTTNFIRSL